MTDYSIIERLRQSLKGPLPGRPAQERMTGRVVSMPVTIPDHARLSAVLCLLFPVGDEWRVLLIKRGEDGSAHSGQVSFPGGSVDSTDPDLQYTALREAEEEVGVSGAYVDILGELTPLYIPVSNFKVFPFVGCSRSRPRFRLSPNEVAFTLEVPCHVLFAPETKTVARVSSPALPGVPLKVNAYQLSDGTVIWGATAMILSELEAIWNKG